ncbi:MAG: PA2779 family protein [Gammaproteobacteria bacterium]
MRLSKSLIYLLILSFIFVQISPAVAGIVATDSFLTEQTVQQDRENLRTLMSRDEVRSLLESNGLTIQEAQERVDSLTDKEVSQMAKKFDELPAAGNAAVVVLVIALVVIILELAGITDIFTGI